MGYLLQRRGPDRPTWRPDVVVQQWLPDDPPRRFAGLEDASEFLDRAYPGNELRMEPDGWYVVWRGVEVCRLVTG